MLYIQQIHFIQFFHENTTFVLTANIVPLNFPYYIAHRIIRGEKTPGREGLSRPALRVATLGIALGVAVMIVTLAIVVGFKKEIREKVVGFQSHIQVTLFDSNTSFEPNPISSKQEFLKNIKAIDNIRHLQQFATKNGIVRTKTETEGILLKGVGRDYDWSFFSSNLKEGKIFSISDTAPAREIIISTQLARRLGLKLNDKLNVFFVTRKKNEDGEESSGYEQRARNFYVCGIYETGFEEFDKKTVIIDIAHIRKLNYWGDDEIAGFEVMVNDFDKLDETEDQLNDIIGHELVASSIRRLNPPIFSWLDLQDINASIVIILMIVVAGINMIAAFLILVLERTVTIGILKALGTRNSQIRKIFVLQASYLLMKGLVWGNVIGLGLCFLQKKFKLITLSQENYSLTSIPVEINWQYLALLNTGVGLVCLILLLLPAMIIAKITPVKAIRFS